jgi:signal-transduction protein with cAMP-binding, CBS, and nucleotidyltransferase domain
MAKSIGDLMSTKIETIDISATAHDAAKKMRDKEVSSLIVVDSSRNIGIVTERDLVRRVCTSDARSRDVPIKQIMSSPIATTDPFSPVEVAADNMIENKIRHLLVEDKNGKALGMITLTDLAAYMKENVNMDEVNATILNALKEEGRYS